jgi:hypothetical protein
MLGCTTFRGVEVRAMHDVMSDMFSEFSNKLAGLPASRGWRGHGSAVFVEFGKLTERPARRDGTKGGAQGQMTLMIQWSWRIEGRRSILGGSWSNESCWPRLFRLLEGTAVRQAALYGLLPEVEITFANDVRLLSFQTVSGDPQWTLFDRSSEPTRWCRTRLGRIKVEEAESVGRISEA